MIYKAYFYLGRISETITSPQYKGNLLFAIINLVFSPQPLDFGLSY